MPFDVEEKKYPNGDSYFEIRVGKEIVGTAIEVSDGYLAQGRKKPVSSLKEAGKQCLDKRMNDCMKEHAHLQILFQ